MSPGGQFHLSPDNRVHIKHPGGLWRDYQGYKAEENMNWYVEVLKKYAVFSGRARRKEYWYFALINIIITTVLRVVAIGIFNWVEVMAMLEIIYTLAVLTPAIAVSVRRLHDTDRSGWWLLVLIPTIAVSVWEPHDTDRSGWWLLVLISLIGNIVLIAYMVQNGKPGENRYGSDPKLFGQSGYAG